MPRQSKLEKYGTQGGDRSHPSLHAGAQRVDADGDGVLLGVMEMVDVGEGVTDGVTEMVGVTEMDPVVLGLTEMEPVVLGLTEMEPVGDTLMLLVRLTVGDNDTLGVTDGVFDIVSDTLLDKLMLDDWEIVGLMVGVTDGVTLMVGVMDGVTLIVGVQSAYMVAAKLLPHISYGPFTTTPEGMPPVS